MGDNLGLLAQQAFAVDWVAGSCLAVLLYDHLITFDVEVNRMWTLRNGIPKTLFILNRYIVSPMLIFNGIASSRKQLSPGFCVFYLRWLVCTITVTTFVIEGILTLRVLALYRNNKIVSFIALFFYISGVSTLIGLTIKDYVGESVIIINDFAELPGCYAAAVPGIIAGYWITQVVVESVLFSMTLFKTIQYMRETGRRSAPPTLVLLARDSTIWYSIVFLLLMTNLLMFEFAPPFLSSLMVTPVNTAGCIAGSRLLLNLRGIAHEAPTSIREGATEMTTFLKFADVVSWRGRKGRNRGNGDGGQVGAHRVGESGGGSGSGSGRKGREKDWDAKDTTSGTLSTSMGTMTMDECCSYADPDHIGECHDRGRDDEEAQRKNLNLGLSGGKTLTLPSNSGISSFGTGTSRTGTSSYVSCEAEGSSNSVSGSGPRSGSAPNPRVAPGLEVPNFARGQGYEYGHGHGHGSRPGSRTQNRSRNMNFGDGVVVGTLGYHVTPIGMGPNVDTTNAMNASEGGGSRGVDVKKDADADVDVDVERGTRD